MQRAGLRVPAGRRAPHQVPYSRSLPSVSHGSSAAASSVPGVSPVRSTHGANATRWVGCGPERRATSLGEADREPAAGGVAHQHDALRRLDGELLEQVDEPGERVAPGVRRGQRVVRQHDAHPEAAGQPGGVPASGSGPARRRTRRRAGRAPCRPGFAPRALTLEAPAARSARPGVRRAPRPPAAAATGRPAAGGRARRGGPARGRPPRLRRRITRDHRVRSWCWGLGTLRRLPTARVVSAANDRGAPTRALRVRDSRRPSNLIRLAPAKEVELSTAARGPLPERTGDDMMHAQRALTTAAAGPGARPPRPACSVGGGRRTGRPAPARARPSWSRPTTRGRCRRRCSQEFTAQTGYTVKVEPNGDAGQLTNKLVLTKGAPIADVVYGIDNTFASRAVDEGVLADYTPSGPAGVRADVRARRRPSGRPADARRLRRRVRQRRRHLVRRSTASRRRRRSTT